MNRTLRYFLLFGFLFLALTGIFNMFNNPNPKMEPIRYDEFVTALDEGKVDSAELQPMQLVYEVKGTMKGYEEGESFITNIPMDDQNVLNKISDLAKEGHEFSYEKAPETSMFASFFMGLLPFIIIIILFFFLLNQAQGGGGGGRMMNFGKSKAKLHTDEAKKVSFNDVAGADEEKQELVEVVDFLKDARKFEKIGARIPKGVLLVGPPGTGKTLLARAVAGEAGVPFFSISGSDFVEMFVGVGASRVRDLFETAKKNSPCIIFIDEIDAVGRQRGAGVGGGHDEREQTLNQLLVEMDGFEGNEGIIIIAATNREDVLDPALLRPGRFDRRITVGVPDVRGREAVLKVHARNKPLDESVNLQAIAQRTPGFSGADLENLLNEAALVAARRGKLKIDMADVDEGMDRVIAGPAKTTRVISEKERTTVAHHEAGHVVIGLTLDDARVVHKVTIIPRGRAGGYAVMLPKEDRGLQTKNELLDQIAGLLGGRVAEDIMFGDVSTGAHNDFQQATGIARAMVTEYGMSDLIGPVQFSQEQSQVFLGRDIGGGNSYSQEVAATIDAEVQRILKEQYERTRTILTERKELLQLIAETLLEEETLDREQILHLEEHGTLPERAYDQRDAIEETAIDADERPVEETIVEDVPTDGSLPEPKSIREAKERDEIERPNDEVDQSVDPIDRPSQKDESSDKS
ncbi:ATP-dependent zinc metalloprotease FtsH [Planococcaceae bacterium Storch 2/2-2]|nr:ATP-dependent zinc metalloprotease FtsH [Planococcaceae bacterium Storch 2/2-2]